MSSHARSCYTLASVIDHTKLTFHSEEDETAAIVQLCNEAIQYRFAAVCVLPRHVALAAGHLKSHPTIHVAAVVGFPAHKTLLAAEQKHPTIGDVPLSQKRLDIETALREGATELDIVLNVRQFRNDYARHDLSETALELNRLCQRAKMTLPIVQTKIIIETDLLSEEETQTATRLCCEAGCSMVKTCTGMVSGGRGATPDVVRTIADTIKLARPEPADRPSIKASGCVRTATQVQELLAAGAARIGTSSGVAIVTEC